MKLSVFFAALCLSTALVIANPARNPIAAPPYQYDMEIAMHRNADADTVELVSKIVSDSCLEATSLRRYGLEKV